VLLSVTDAVLYCLVFGTQARFVQLKSRTVLVLAAFVGVQVVSLS